MATTEDAVTLSQEKYDQLLAAREECRAQCAPAVENARLWLSTELGMEITTEGFADALKLGSLDQLHYLRGFTSAYKYWGTYELLDALFLRLEAREDRAATERREAREMERILLEEDEEDG